MSRDVRKMAERTLRREEDYLSRVRIRGNRFGDVEDLERVDHIRKELKRRQMSRIKNKKKRRRRSL